MSDPIIKNNHLIVQPSPVDTRAICHSVNFISSDSGVIYFQYFTSLFQSNDDTYFTAIPII